MNITHLRVVSDLHLEGFSNFPVDMLFQKFISSANADDVSALVLAGDISSKPAQLIEFVSYCATKFAKVIFVPGNHEYYKSDFDERNIEIDKGLSTIKNVLFATDDVRCSLITDDVRVIYGTLWGDGGFSTKDRFTISSYLNDFKLITRTSQGSKFTVDHMIQLYKAQKKQIKEFLNTPFNGNTIVVTHHLPSRSLVSARYLERDGSDGANGGFVGACDDLLEGDVAPKLWIHGHTHDTIYTKIHRTTVVCNPAGYRGEWNTVYNGFMSNVQNMLMANPVIIKLDSL